MHCFHWHKLFSLRQNWHRVKTRRRRSCYAGSVFLPELLCNTIYFVIVSGHVALQLEKRGCADTFIHEIRFNEHIANILRSRVSNYKSIKTAVVSNGIHKGMTNVVSGNASRVVFTMLKKDLGGNSFCGCTWWWLWLLIKSDEDFLENRNEVRVSMASSF
jgi:hypothetical protein